MTGEPEALAPEVSSEIVQPIRQRLFALWANYGLWVFLMLCAPGSLFAEEVSGPPSRFSFQPIDETRVPAPFRLEPRADIATASKPIACSAQSYQVWEVTFPSPVVTACVNNNTVYCELFLPTGGKAAACPGVVVLHILGGDFELARLFCRALATRGSAALFLKMPYYGPRRQPNNATRMVSADPRATVAGMTQAIKDVRYATAWLANHPRIDKHQLGIMGISLGGITGALALTAEPQLQKGCFLLAGGDMGKIAWESKELRPLRDQWLAQGGTRNAFFELLSTIDPVTYAANAREKTILMLNARHDEVVPPACTESLWKAFGQPQIEWWNAGHYTAARYIFVGLDKASRFFEPSADGAQK
jgi:dienelactone hydrolase